MQYGTFCLFMVEDKCYRTRFKKLLLLAILLSHKLQHFKKCSEADLFIVLQ